MFEYHNRKFLIILTCLLLVGVMSIYSASQAIATIRYNNPFYYVTRQLLFIFVGYIMMFIMSNIDYLKIRKYNKYFLIICLLLMILVLLFGVERNGSKSWFKVGSFLIQPSEFLKMALIFTSADLLANKRKIKNLRHDLLTILCLIGISFILIMLQPDFGSGMIMVSSIIVMIIVAGLPMKYFVFLGILGIIGIVALIVAAPYRLMRIYAFIDPFKDPLGSGFQSIQALYALSPGGLFGLGFLNSMQKHFYLPEPHTDFIFAIICEELGFFGAIIIVGSFILLLKESMKIIKDLHNTYLCLIVVGIISLFIIQAIINLGVVVGLFPITGVTLPFISYGGSSLVLIMMSMGIVMSINKNKWMN